MGPCCTLPVFSGSLKILHVHIQKAEDAYYPDGPPFPSAVGNFGSLLATASELSESLTHRACKPLTHTAYITRDR